MIVRFNRSSIETTKYNRSHDLQVRSSVLLMLEPSQQHPKPAKSTKGSQQHCPPLKNGYPQTRHKKAKKRRNKNKSLKKLRKATALWGKVMLWMVDGYWRILGWICGVPTLASHWHGLEGRGIDCIWLVHLMTYWMEQSYSLNISNVFIGIVYALWMIFVWLYVLCALFVRSFNS